MLPAMALAVLAVGGGRIPAGLLAVVLAALTFRVATTTAAWRESSVLLAEQVRLLGTLPRGARLYPLVTTPSDRRVAKIEQGLYHAASYAVIERGVWTPTTFANRGQHSLLHRWPRPYDDATHPPERIDWRALRGGYVWSYRAGAWLERWLDTCGEPVGQSGRGRLYRVPWKKSRDAAAPAVK